jgi:pantothenate kinase
LAKLHKFVIEEKQKIDKNIDYLSQLSKDCDTDYKEVEKEFLEVFSNEQGVIEWYNSVKNENDFIAKLNRFDKMRGAIKNQKESKEKKITPEVAYQLVMQLKEFFTPYFELSSPLKVV